jgi:hypothetical protein
VVELHYYGHLTAPQIAVEMALPGPRRVYTLIDRALVRLRAMLEPPIVPHAEIRRSNGTPVDTHPPGRTLD